MALPLGFSYLCLGSQRQQHGAVCRAAVGAGAASACFPAVCANVLKVTCDAATAALCVVAVSLYRKAAMPVLSLPFSACSLLRFRSYASPLASCVLGRR